MNSSPIRLEKHEPERRPSSATAYCGACCCCCCCCLHTVGALVGAAVAPLIPAGSSSRAGLDNDDMERPGVSAVALFWWISLGLAVIGILVGVLNSDVGSLIITLIILALIMPGLQLVSALLVIFIMLCWPRPDRGAQVVQMGKVAGGVIAGSALGIAAMFGIGALLSALAR